MNNINVINNAEKDIDITVNNNNGKIEIIIDLKNKDFKLSKNLKAGDVFKDKDGEEYILLYFMSNGDAVVLKNDSLKSMEFGSNNNYNGCNIDKYLCGEYLPELERKFGKNNIVEHEVDLLSLDGEDDYSKITRKVSILTLDEYRHNKKAIKNYINEWFWLCTPNSTPSGYGSYCVRCVDSDGFVDYSWYGNCRAVHPRFVLSSYIFES